MFSCQTALKLNVAELSHVTKPDLQKPRTDEDEFVNVPKQLRKHYTLQKLDVIDPEESIYLHAKPGV